MPERLAQASLYAATLPLFGRALGPALFRYRPAVRALHSVGDATVVYGHSDIRRGSGSVARLVGWLFGFPPAGRRMPTAITVVATGEAEIWHRRFARHRIVTHLEPEPASLRPTISERFRFGVTFDLGLLEQDGRLRFELTAMRVCGIPMPRVLWPVLNAEERAERGGFRFDIEIGLGRFGPLIHYRGWVRPGPAATGPSALAAAQHQV
jgi:hypothetical protein